MIPTRISIFYKWKKWKKWNKWKKLKYSSYEVEKDGWAERDAIAADDGDLPGPTFVNFAT
jgi:hypothetical protein